MNFRMIAAGCLLAMAAQAQHARHYSVTDLGTLGGSYSYGYGINNSGMIAGGAATPAQSGGLLQTAFAWVRGTMVNLGTLGGAACGDCNSEGAQVRSNGEVLVLSETAKMDANGEDFCGFGTHRQCLGGVWREGHLEALPTLPGGQNASVIWGNDRGEGVGYSETGMPDFTCAVPYQVRRFSGARWTRDGKVQELRPLPGDTVSFAFGINDRGQAVGVSGLCSNVTLPATGTPDGPHATLWDSDGTPVALGSLPNGVTTMPTGITNGGDIVGNVHFADGSVHPFLWSKQGGMRDLGVVPGDFVTIIPCCGAINNRGDMVGFSCGPVGCRAVLYRNRAWVALNDLTSSGSPLDLQFASSISESGEITGWGMTATGDTHAFLARPGQ